MIVVEFDRETSSIAVVGGDGVLFKMDAGYCQFKTIS